MFVIAPVCLGLLDVALLPRFRSVHEQDHEPLPLLPEIHPASRTEIDPPFGDALPDRLHVPEIPGLDAGNRRADPRRGPRIEIFEPRTEGTVPGLRLVLDYLDHESW